MSVPTDAELVASAQAGDAAALAHLLNESKPHVLGEIRRYISDPDAVQDVFQDASIKAWQRIALFRGDSAFRTWFTRIAVNTAKDAQRKAKPERFDRGVDADDLAAIPAIEPEEQEESETLRLIKQAHATGGRPVTVAEAIEFVERPIYMGPPEPRPRRGTRGPLPRGTQYDEHAKRQQWVLGKLKRIYHLYMRLPHAGAKARRKTPKK